MSSEYSYDKIFQRNMGIFTPEEQEKIKKFKRLKYSRYIYNIYVGCVYIVLVIIFRKVA